MPWSKILGVLILIVVVMTVAVALGAFDETIETWKKKADVPLSHNASLGERFVRSVAILFKNLSDTEGWTMLAIGLIVIIGSLWLFSVKFQGMAETVTNALTLTIAFLVFMRGLYSIELLPLGPVEWLVSNWLIGLMVVVTGFFAFNGWLDLDKG